MNAKIITVWGANGSGKTTLAVNLGLALAERNMMVGVISSKLYYGELQSMFGKRIEEDKGLYRAISNGCNTKNMFEEAGKNINLFFLSVPNKFDGMLLTAVSGETIRELIEDAAMRFDCIIIDGSEELNNPVSGIGLTVASKIVVVHHVSAKDCLWQFSMENTMRLLHLQENILHVLNGYDHTCDKAAYLNNIGIRFGFELPYIQNAKALENAGKQIYRSGMGTKEYKKVMQRLASQLING